MSEMRRPTIRFEADDPEFQVSGINEKHTRAVWRSLHGDLTV